MLTAAIEAGGAFEPFNQYTMGATGDYDHSLGRGMCHGLSMKFLACAKNGESFTAVVSARALQVPGQYQETPLHTEIFTAATAGNVGGHDKEEEAEFARDTYGLNYVESRRFGDMVAKGSAWRCADYLAGGGGGPFMLGVPGHAMAAVCRKGGEHFFDPNCGIFHGTKASHLRDFFAAYFGHSFVKLMYGHNAAPVIAARTYR